MRPGAERYGLPGVAPPARRPSLGRKGPRPFTPIEVDLICSGADEGYYRNYIITRFYTGLRTGEINNLKWRHISFEDALISVRGTSTTNGPQEEALPEFKVRDVPMLPIVKRALLDQWQTHDPENGYVFTSFSGSRVDAHNFTKRAWKPLLRRLSVVYRRPYETRHTTAVLMLLDGRSPEWVAQMMGFAHPDTVRCTYTQFLAGRWP